MSKKTYVLDTSVYLTDFKALQDFGSNDILLPMMVLEEIDGHKTRQDGVGNNARHFIHVLDELREKGSIFEGVRIGKGKGMLQVANYDVAACPQGFDLKVPDNEIILVALSAKLKDPEKDVILVSRDVNMRVKCDALQIKAEDYNKSRVVDDASEIYTGFTTVVVEDTVIDDFYSKASLGVTLKQSETQQLFPNQFVMLQSSIDQKRTGLARFIDYSKPLQKVKEYNDMWGLKARNREQRLAIDLLMDNNISLVTLAGTAGSGKTIISLSCGLQQVLGPDPKYKKLVVARPIQPMGKDIGFTPGNVLEKLLPWLGPIQDNLENLLGDRAMLEDYIERGIIEVEALTYIRGRSISNAFIIIDESQNLTLHEVKTILTRVGEGTKIILTGDYSQLDNIYLDSASSGITHAIEKMKSYEASGHITLLKGERSRLATYVSSVF